MPNVALITGGTRGIGRAIAAAFAADHNVAVTWRTTPPRDVPDQVHPIQADLTDPEACARVVAWVIDRFGRLDVIVNNAGAITAQPLDAFDPAPLRHMFDVNLLAPGALLSAALPHLQPGAAIVNISSVNAALPPKDAVHYGASKAALELWTRGMAKELGPRGIRVNAVAPGAIETPDAPRPPQLVAAFVKDTALGRTGRPEDIARAVRFLAGATADFITGETLTVSGGYRL